MSKLINDTIEAYNLFIEGELSLEELEYGIEAGLISESLLEELSNTMLSEDINQSKVMLHNKREAAFAKLDNHVLNVDGHVKKIGTHANPDIREKLHNLITQDAIKNINEKSKALRTLKKDISNMKDESESKDIAARIKNISKDISNKEKEYNSHMSKHF